jgi:C-terminal processing protease CtpA/Prc
MYVWMYVGDILIAVDRRRVTTSGEVKSLMMGERGTSVALSFERHGHVFEVTLLRERVWGAYSFTLADQALMSSKV